jgi:hypothetical protein
MTETPAPAPPSRSRRILRRCALATVPIVVLAGLVEIGFRIAGVGRIEVWPVSTPDGPPVARRAPDGRESLYRDRVELGHPVFHNEIKCRDWLWHEDEREGRLRVALLGDSFTEGTGVGDGERWGDVLGAALDADPPGGRRCRVLNFGRAAANTVYEVGVLRDHALRFRPDAVVLGFTVFNDAESFAQYHDAGRTRAAYWEPWHRRAAMWLKDRSYAFNWAVNVSRRGLALRSMREHLERLHAEDAAGWTECREALASIAASCREAGVPLVVVLFPVHHDDLALNAWAAYPHRDVHGRIAKAVEALPGARVVDATPSLVPLTGRKIWVDKDRHPNELWHRAVGEAVAPVVREVLRQRSR